jgi:small subunit ribosomal protein S2
MSNTNTDKLKKVGAHYGYSRTRRHPSAKPFIETNTNGVDFINLSITASQIENAKELLKKIKESGKQVVFVSTKPEMKQIIKELALSVNMPYIADRYIGGVFTNYPQIKKRIEKLHTLLKQKENGELNVYTKKEQLLIAKDMERLDRNFGGLSNLVGLPAAAIIVDVRKEYMCCDEATRMNIPVIGLTNTDGDVKSVTNPIVCNDSAPQVVRSILEDLKSVLA